MVIYLKALALFFLLTGTGLLSAQDTERPLPPTLDLVTVNPFTGHTSLEWTAGGSPDVAGYVIYLYVNEEGYAIDTIFQPGATSYTNTASNASYYTESYVIAAIDSSDNISPLSNFLNTIFISARLDTCKHELELSWNSYLTIDPTVNEYIVYSSNNGSDYYVAGVTNDTTFITESFESYSEYCFYVEASLSNGSSSFSNIICINTELPVPPAWINADYASYNSYGEVELSFTFDPDSEYNKYRIERTTNLTSGFDDLNVISTTDTRIEFTDTNPNDGINYYRLAALNSCDEPIEYSNLASTINLSLTIEGDLIKLEWNRYYSWEGGISSYTIFRNNRGFFEEIFTQSSSDTTASDYLKDFMYSTNQNDICYRIMAHEGMNPRFNNATSSSEIKCIEQPVEIYVPNAFTPDNNSVNEVFKPVLSFTPVKYKLIIKNRAGITLFQTNDHLEGWNGWFGSRKMPEDVYIWFIELETPEGKTITKTGTITIIFNQDTPL